VLVCLAMLAAQLSPPWQPSRNVGFCCPFEPSLHWVAQHQELVANSEYMAASGALFPTSVFLQKSCILNIHTFHKKVFDTFP